MDRTYRYLDTDTLARLVDELYDEVCIYDNHYRMVYINKACLRHYGFEPDDLIGKELTIFEHDKWWDTSILPHVYRDKKAYAIRQKTIVGSKLFTVAVPIFDRNNEIEFVVMSVRDTVSDNLIFTGENTAIVASADELRPELLYESDEMKAIMDSIQRVGRTDANCLIVGESGTGKTALAKYMHKISDRQDKPFISVNCASLPRELVESELFGYVKGAFTGAKSGGKTGLFEAANHGTLLLDEIGDLPLDLQAKLLRAIQNREITRVGSTKARRLDIRFLSLTNSNLREKVAAGTFRSDLFYRLNVIPIQIPPLRARPEDIPELVEHFLEIYRRKYQRSITLTPKSMDILTRYRWPGNVRELENALEYLALCCPEGDVVQESVVLDLLRQDTVDEALQPVSTLGDAVSHYEKTLIEQALRNTNSMRSAAEALGVNVSTISRKIKQYNIHLP